MFAGFCLFLAIVNYALAITNGAGIRHESRQTALHSGASPALVTNPLGTYHIKNAHGICLDALDHNSGKGMLKLWTCNNSKSTQQWTYNNYTGLIKNRKGLCLHAVKQNSNGGQVCMCKCNAARLNQQWSFDGMTRLIRNKLGICLTVASGVNTSGGTPSMWACDMPNVNRQWNLVSVAPKSDEADLEQGPIPSFVFYKILVQQVRGYEAIHWRFGWLQIGDIYLKDAHGQVYRDLRTIPVEALNEDGRSPASEEASKAIDGDLDTKWLDFHKQPIVLKFSRPVPVKWIAIVTANDCVWRDPVRFIVKASYNGYHWLDLYNTYGEDYATPEVRKTQSPWVPLSMPPVINGNADDNDDDGDTADQESPCQCDPHVYERGVFKHPRKNKRNGQNPSANQRNGQNPGASRTHRSDQNPSPSTPGSNQDLPPSPPLPPQAPEVSVPKVARPQRNPPAQSDTLDDNNDETGNDMHDLDIHNHFHSDTKKG